MTTSTTRDIVIIGGGHNGLVTAFYLLVNLALIIIPDAPPQSRENGLNAEQVTHHGRFEYPSPRIDQWNARAIYDEA